MFMFHWPVKPVKLWTTLRRLHSTSGVILHSTWIVLVRKSVSIMKEYSTSCHRLETKALFFSILCFTLIFFKARSPHGAVGDNLPVFTVVRQLMSSSSWRSTCLALLKGKALLKKKRALQIIFHYSVSLNTSNIYEDPVAWRNHKHSSRWCWLIRGLLFLPAAETIFDAQLKQNSQWTHWNLQWWKSNRVRLLNYCT